MKGSRRGIAGNRSPVPRESYPKPVKRGDLLGLIDDMRKAKLPGPSRPSATETEEHVKKISGAERKDVTAAVANAVYSATKRWDTDVLLADTKYRGVRGLIVIDPEKKRVKVLSRTFSPYGNYGEVFTPKIMADIDRIETDMNRDGKRESIVLDAELWGKDVKGKYLEQGTASGFAKNPEGDEYANIRPVIETFDIYMVDGVDVRELDLGSRRAVLESLLGKKGKILKPTKAESIPNTEKNIRESIENSLKEGQEGVVFKDPTEPVFAHKKGHWLKAKHFDTIDLELQRVRAYPAKTAEKYNGFHFYKHWDLMPADAPQNSVTVDKPAAGAGMDDEWYAKFTRKMLKDVETGRAVGYGGSKVDPEKTVVIDGKRMKLIDYYGTDSVPGIIFPYGRKVVEIKTEEISENKNKSGQFGFPALLIVNPERDKKNADSMEDIRKMKTLHGRQNAAYNGVMAETTSRPIRSRSGREGLLKSKIRGNRS